MTYTDFNHKKGKLINDKSTVRLIELLDTAQLKEISNDDICNCNAITKNEYVIRFIYQGLKREFILNEKFDCSDNSKCLIIQWLREAFMKNE